MDEEILNDYLRAFRLIQKFLEENDLFSESDVNTIHYFLGQLLAFGCIYFSKFSHQVEQKEKKKSIFFQIFKKKNSIDEYKFNQTDIQKYLHEKTEISSKNLPTMFQDNEKTKEFSKWKFKKKQLELLYKSLWDSKEFYLIEELDEEVDSVDKKITAAVQLCPHRLGKTQHIEQNGK